MNDTARRDIVEQYLRRLERALADLPAADRRDLLEDVRGHIEDAWAASTERTESALRSILDRLGEPETLAREYRERMGTSDPHDGGNDLLSVVAIVLTAFVWPVGVLLAWLSSRWAARDKAIATALPVVGFLLFVSLSLGVSTSISAQPAVGQPTTAPAPGDGAAARFVSTTLALYGLLGTPLTSAMYLALRRRPHPRRWTVLVPVLGAIVVTFGALVLFLMPGGSVVSEVGTSIVVPR